MTPSGYAELRSVFESMRPTLLVHPEDEESVRAAAAETDFNPKIEVTQLVEPGQVVVFKGTKWPVMDMGAI